MVSKNPISSQVVGIARCLSPLKLRSLNTIHLASRISRIQTSSAPVTSTCSSGRMSPGSARCRRAWRFAILIRYCAGFNRRSCMPPSTASATPVVEPDAGLAR